MAWSHLRTEKAEAVEALLDDLPRDPEDLKVLGRSEAADIIHAVLWLRAARKESAAAVYAWTALAESLGAERLRALLAACDAER